MPKRIPWNPSTREAHINRVRATEEWWRDELLRRQRGAAPRLPPNPRGSIARAYSQPNAPLTLHRIHGGPTLFSALEPRLRSPELRRFARPFMLQRLIALSEGYTVDALEAYRMHGCRVVAPHRAADTRANNSRRLRAELKRFRTSREEVIAEYRQRRLERMVHMAQLVLPPAPLTAASSKRIRSVALRLVALAKKQVDVENSPARIEAVKNSLDEYRRTKQCRLPQPAGAPAAPCALSAGRSGAARETTALDLFRRAQVHKKSQAQRRAKKQERVKKHHQPHHVRRRSSTVFWSAELQRYLALVAQHGPGQPSKTLPADDLAPVVADRAVAAKTYQASVANALVGVSAVTPTSSAARTPTKRAPLRLWALSLRLLAAARRKDQRDLGAAGVAIALAVASTHTC